MRTPSDAIVRDGHRPPGAGAAETTAPPVQVGPERQATWAVEHAMDEAARDAWPPITRADLEVAHTAGAHARALARADPRPPVADAADHAAVAAAVDATERAVAVQRLGPRHEPGHASWDRAGIVVPVLAASGGVGCSVLAAALYDALDAAGVRVLLVDAADPHRSGLSSAARSQGAPARTLHPDVGVAFARRGNGWVAQMATRPGSVLSAAMVPAPSWWLPKDTPSAPEVTVVDLGWDPWSLASAPLRGPGAWLEAGTQPPRPVLAVAPTRPGLAQANQLLARLRPWMDTGRTAPIAALAVIGARRWPRDVPGVAARALGALVTDAVFVANDAEVRTAGIGPRPVSPRLQRSVTPLLARLSLNVQDPRIPRHTARNQLSRRT